jgi:Protein of unknown function (DUF3833)
MIRSILASLLLVGSLSACAGTRLDQVAQKTPVLDLNSYFVGQTKAYGLFEDRFGKIRRQFVVTIDGRMDGNDLILDEAFVYNDGERQRRVWRMTPKGNGVYEGRADDVIGVAQGKLSGNAFNLRYKLNLKVDEKSTWKVSFNDWMLLQPDGVLLNRAYVDRFGVQIGSVTLAFVKKP